MNRLNRLNFSGGPGALPESVLLQAREAMIEVPEVGLSVLGISHRSDWFAAVVSELEANIHALLGLPENYHVLRLQGGATQQFTMLELQQWIAKATGRNRLFIEVPDAVSGFLASGFGWAPGAPITKDQWLMLQHDNVVSTANGLAALGIAPTALADVADGWLVQYRRHGRFAAMAR